MKHLSSNGCLSSLYISSFPMQRGYPKSDILCAIWVLIPEQKWHSANHDGLKGVVRSSSTFLIHPRKVMKHSSSNVCFYLKHFIPSPMLREGTHNLASWIQFQSQPWQKWQDANHKRLVDIIKIFSYMPYLVLDIMKHFNSNGCHSLQYIMPISMCRGYSQSSILYEIW